jgi:hypothetical protein
MEDSAAKRSHRKDRAKGSRWCRRRILSPKSLFDPLSKVPTQLESRWLSLADMASRCGAASPHPGCAGKRMRHHRRLHRAPALMTADSPTAGDAAAKFIGEELEVERARKSSLESRGFAVITTSGALVTLLFGLTGLVTKNSSFDLTDTARWLLVAAAILFVLAGTIGIACNLPFFYYQVDPVSLSIFVTPPVWTEAGVDAERELAAARLAQLADGRARNEWKGKLLAAAMALQLTAILVTAIAISVILFNR